MEEKKPTVNNTPVSLEGLTFLLLLGLKLTGAAQIDWIVVFLPLLITPILLFILGVIGVAIMTAVGIVKKSRAKKEVKRRQDEWTKAMEDRDNPKGEKNE